MKNFRSKLTIINVELKQKYGFIVCSTTLWIGHLSKLVQQEELSDTFGEFGDIVSIDLIPPRGCAFICMNRRQDAYRALQDLKHHKLQGKAITVSITLFSLFSLVI